jgi:predicted acylesterase/phospholipase RssA
MESQRRVGRRAPRPRIRILIGIAIALGAAFVNVISCAHSRRTVPIASVNRHDGYRFEQFPPNARNTNRTLIVLAFSGGGTRAASLAYGVLTELERAQWCDEDSIRNLLDEVDLISSTSGGSFAAAYFGLWGKDSLHRFPNVFLKWNAKRALALRVANPLNWGKLASRKYSRIDVAAELWGDRLFANKTYGDLLLRHERPYIVLNSTDMTLGALFSFTQEQFDPLCADLARYPIGHAVAASSAFPMLLSPLTIKNNAGVCRYELPQWAENALNQRDQIPLVQRAAANLASYDDKARPFLHLIDGGLTDNIGGRVPFRALVDQGEYSFMKILVDERNRPNRVIYILVNARTLHGTKRDQRENTPHFWEVLQAAANAPMDNYTLESVSRIGEAKREWEHVIAQLGLACDTTVAPNAQETCDRFYGAEVSFARIADPKRRRWFEALPTTFQLPEATVDSLIQIGGDLLRDSRDYKALLRDLSANTGAAPRCHRTGG